MECQVTASTSPKFKPKKPLSKPTLLKPRRFSIRTESGYSIGGRVWLEKDGKLYIGVGRMMLLERIDELGSIAAAARSMKLGYRNAWLWVDSINRFAPAPLVENVTGGSGGRHAILTEEGRKAIREYKELSAKFLEFLGQAV